MYKRNYLKVLSSLMSFLLIFTGQELSVSAADVHTLYAQWGPTPYNITYDLDGGTLSGTNPETYTIEDSITLKSPSKYGYSFLGWTGANGTVPQKNAVIARGNTGDRHYIAKYTENVDVNIVTRTTDYKLGDIPGKIHTALTNAGVAYTDTSLNIIGLQTIEGGFDVRDATPNTIYYSWDQYPNPNNYTLNGNVIINAVYDWNGYGSSKRSSSTFNQLFIENNSYDTTDFELSSTYA